MGSRIAQKLADAEHEVFVWNRSSEDVAELKKVAKVEGHESIESLVKSLPAPRIVWIMVPHAAVEEVLTEVRKFISAGDIVIDGGNSNYKDTDRRFAEFEKNGIKFLGIGVSGGIIAFKNGYPLMAGGNREAYDLIKPIFDTLSNPDGGYGFFGIGGAGHFVKMVHNGIEYGDMQLICEAYQIMKDFVELSYEEMYEICENLLWALALTLADEVNEIEVIAEIINEDPHVYPVAKWDDDVMLVTFYSRNTDISHQAFFHIVSRGYTNDERYYRTHRSRS